MAVPDSTATTAPDFPSDYVSLSFDVDEFTLADDAITNLQATWTDWEANDGDYAAVLIETLAPLAAAAVQKAAEMPPAAFIALGTKLYGIDYQQGMNASTTVTLTFQDDAGGYLVPGGSEFTLGGFGFQTVSDVYSTAGSTTVSGVAVMANDVGELFNQLSSVDWANVSMPVWVTNLATEAATTGGIDPQSDQDYLDMLSRELQLRGRIIVTLPDYEIVAMNTDGIGRAYAITDSARNVTVYLTDPDGEIVQQSVKDGLAAIYEAERLVNTTVTLADATYTTVDVVYEAVALPGFDLTGLEDSINVQLGLTLSPSGWGTVGYGQPGMGPLSWINSATIHLNKLISLIGNVPGVDYVVANSVQINGIAADLSMPGPVALPRPGTFTGTIDPPTAQ